jgi:hypothetical protein
MTITIKYDSDRLWYFTIKRGRELLARVSGYGTFLEAAQAAQDAMTQYGWKG